MMHRTVFVVFVAVVACATDTEPVVSALSEGEGEPPRLLMSSTCHDGRVDHFQYALARDDYDLVLVERLSIDDMESTVVSESVPGGELRATALRVPLNPSDAVMGRWNERYALLVLEETRTFTDDEGNVWHEDACGDSDSGDTGSLAHRARRMDGGSVALLVQSTHVGNFVRAVNRRRGSAVVGASGEAVEVATLSAAPPPAAETLERIPDRPPFEGADE